MKIRLNTTNLMIQKQNAFVQRAKTNQIQQNTKPMELSSFNSIGRSMVVFRGETQDNPQNNIDLRSKTVKELKELKLAMLENNAESEEIIKDAQEKLNAIESWDYFEENLKQENAAEREIKEKGLSRFLNPFQCYDIREKHYDNFSSRNSVIRDYCYHKKQYEDIVRMSPLNAEQTKNFIASIDDMIAQKMQIEEQEKRLNGIEGVKNAIEAMNNAHGGLDDRIAGYDYEKDEIKRAFIHPLSESQNKPEVKVPSSVLLYGASGTGKTTFLYGIKHEAKEKGYARVISMPSVNNSEDFMRILKEEFRKARTLYLERGDNDKPKKIRTILLFNDAEQYFGMSYEQAKKVYGDLIDEADADKLQNLNHDPKLINNFKSILDSCSGIPSKDAPDDTLDNSATTIFITTNYPHLIDRDLIRKFDVMLPINPAKNVNLEEVMKHYFKKCSDVLDEVKKAAQNPNFNERDLKFLTCYLNQKSINTLMKMAEEGTLDKLSINWKNIPYDKIAKDFNPSKAKGAFDNMQLRDLAIASLNDYIEDPARNYSGHYYARLYSEPRKLDPVRYKHFVDIFNTLAPLNKQEEIDPLIMQRREKEVLLGIERLSSTENPMSEKDKKRLEYIRTHERHELNYLEYKEKDETLSEEEKIRLADIRKSIEAEKINDVNIDEDEDY